MEAHLTGAFPRSEALVELTRAAARGKVSENELEDGFRKEVLQLVMLQTEAEIDSVVDGQLNWQDLFRPFSEILTGIRPGSLTRWFDNNTFYRKPTIVEKVRYGGGSLDRYFRHNLLPKDRPRRAVLPGPYTFALLSQNIAYQSFEDLIDDLAHALRDVATKLKIAGYQYLQFNDPSICVSEPSQDQLAAVRQAYEVLAKGMDAKTVLHTYFGDAGSIIEFALDLPTDSIGIDFYATSVDSLSEHDFTKELECGCLDARNSLLETPDGLKKLIVRIQDAVRPKGISVATNCDLDFLPYGVAARKLNLLATAKKIEDG